jgi:hypothetical protein
MKKITFAGITFAAVAFAAYALAQNGASTLATGRGDLPALRMQVQQFSNTLNRDLQTVVEHPFAMLQDAKGIYLPRYGVVFHMELNLAPLRTISAFDVRPYTEQELQQARQTKLQRVRQLKDRLSELLRERGGDLSALPADQSIGIVVHLFNMPSERTEGLPTQFVVEISRGAIIDAKARSMTAEEFRNKVSFLDF